MDDLFNDSSVKGALWVADFLPANDKTIFVFDGKVIYYKYNKNRLLNPDYTLNELMTISKTQPIKVADFMIWDPVLRIALHKIIATLRNELVNTIIATQEIRDRFDLVYDTTSNILSIISNIPGSSPKTKAISSTSEIINYIGLPILKSIFNYIVPSLNVNLVNYTNYLSRLETHLEPKLEGNPITVSDIFYAYNETFKVKQVVCFPIFICLGNRNEYSIQTLEHYYTTTLYNIDINYNFNSYQKVISTIDSSSVLKGGKIYKFKNIEDIKNIDKLELASNHIHDYKNHYCTICNKYTQEHEYNEYKWYDYNKH